MCTSCDDFAELEWCVGLVSVAVDRTSAIVDSLSTLAVALLQRDGHIVTVVDTGAAAVAAATTEELDVIFMDVQMPEMSGLEATAAIRARERTTGAHVAIIAMTAHAMQGDRERCLAAGMDDYVAKPIGLAALRSALERVRPGDQVRNVEADHWPGKVVVRRVGESMTGNL